MRIETRIKAENRQKKKEKNNTNKTSAYVVCVLHVPEGTCY